MARILATILMTLTLAMPVRAQQGDIQTVIQSQLDAFLADDFVTAFTFAAPGIKSMFGTPDNFGAMVRQGYPMVWRPAEVSYLGQETRGGRIVQRVLITDTDGAVHTLEYFMIQTENGWQISGVDILRAPGAGV